ncbi:MAG: hypothetical protein ABI169_18315 [Chitinophagaceae bacterium]
MAAKGYTLFMENDPNMAAIENNSLPMQLLLPYENSLPHFNRIVHTFREKPDFEWRF